MIPADPIVVLLVLALATYRAARLIATDTLTVEVRAAVYRFAWEEPEVGPAVARGRKGWRSYVYELITCPYCIGVWMAVLLYGLWDHWHGIRWAILIAAIAGAQAFLQSLPEDK